MSSITSANAVFVISCPALGLVSVTLAGYSADRAWETADVDLSESQMSIDGRKTSGYTPVMVTQTISFQADSPSRTVFQGIINAMKQSKDVYPISGTIMLPATDEVYNGINGTIKSFSALPNAQKVLQPLNYVIEWESLDQSNT